MIEAGKKQHVPKPVETEGDPNEVVPLQVKLPRWMKTGLHQLAQQEGRDLSEMLRELIRRAMDEARIRVKR
jgi:hypothetical protein